MTSEEIMKALGEEMPHLISDDVLNVLERTEGVITREELRQLTGYSDRQIRKAIEVLRCAGAPIGKPEDGKGYIYGDKTAVNRAIMDSYSRIAAEFKKIRGLQGIPIDGQISITMQNKQAEIKEYFYD